MKSTILALSMLTLLAGCGQEDTSSLGQAGTQSEAVNLLDQMGWKDPEGGFFLLFTDFTIDAADRAKVLREHSPMALVDRGRVLVAHVRMKPGLDPANAIGSKSVEKTGLTFWNFADSPIVIEKMETEENADSMFPGFNAALTENGWASGMMRGTQMVERRGEKSVFLWNVGFQVSF
jgi:hypothetical protein